MSWIPRSLFPGPKILPNLRLIEYFTVDGTDGVGTPGIAGVYLKTHKKDYPLPVRNGTIAEGGRQYS